MTCWDAEPTPVPDPRSNSGANIERVSEDEVAAVFVGGKIRYLRESADAPFQMYLEEVQDVDGLVCALDEIETKYGGNVQSYTYDKIMSELPANMVLQSEEVLEDNTILLTITVD